jgi:hypothetical protein
MKRRAWWWGQFNYGIAVAALMATVAYSRPARAQVRVSLGAGGGIAGSTESSLSEGRGGLLLMGQIAHIVVPFVGIGAEVNHWTRSGSNITFATGIVQVHVPLTGLYLKAGAGYGSGDPDGLGRVSGLAGEVGLAYDLTLPGAPIAITLFGNGAVAHASSRSLQMAGAGIALTFR